MSWREERVSEFDRMGDSKRILRGWDGNRLWMALRLWDEDFGISSWYVDLLKLLEKGSEGIC